MTLTRAEMIPTKTNDYVIAMAIAVIAAANIFLGNLAIAGLLTGLVIRVVVVEYRYRKFAVEWNAAIAELAALDSWFLDYPVPLTSVHR
jgi:hypothetical protein